MNSSSWVTPLRVKNETQDHLNDCHGWPYSTPCDQPNVFRKSNFFLWRAVKDKCYANHPEMIEALKYEIEVAIHGIEAQTIENVLKNWVERMGYCKASNLKRYVKNKNCGIKLHLLSCMNTSDKGSNFYRK